MRCPIKLVFFSTVHVLYCAFKLISVLALHLIFFYRLSPFNFCFMSFCSLIKGITPKIRVLCFVLINSVLLNLLCVWIIVYVFGSCFRTVVIILASYFIIIYLIRIQSSGLAITRAPLARQNATITIPREKPEESPENRTQARSGFILF